jgi:hypothetical protein
MLDLCLGGLFSLGVKESLPEFVEEVPPGYQIVMLVVYPGCGG